MPILSNAHLGIGHTNQRRSENENRRQKSHGNPMVKSAVWFVEERTNPMNALNRYFGYNRNESKNPRFGFGL